MNSFQNKYFVVNTLYDVFLSQLIHTLTVYIDFACPEIQNTINNLNETHSIAL